MPRELFAIELSSKNAEKLHSLAQDRNCSVSEVVDWLLNVVSKMPDLEAETQAGAKTRRAYAERGIAKANRALAECISLLYEQDSKGQFLNFDVVDGRILIPMPWSRQSHLPYGLNDQDHRVLRDVMIEHLQKLPPEDRLLRLSNDRWFLNVQGFPTLEDAQRWLAAIEIVPGDWLRCSNKRNAVARRRTRNQL